eukprot:Lithocolla_globosa_v1_NODE_2083_length_2176_cov_11.145215.p1 type:complete len:268 gc:universal NODE_2083_length_2176_cov_11.145215:1177-374(-)
MAIDFACWFGRTGTVRYLLQNRNDGYTNLAMDFACRKGNLELVKFLHEFGQNNNNNNSIGCSKAAMDWASRNGHLEVMKWLHNNRKEGCSLEALCMAGKFSHQNCMDWLVSNRSECQSELAFSFLDWYRENKTTGTSSFSPTHSSNQYLKNDLLPPFSLLIWITPNTWMGKPLLRNRYYKEKKERVPFFTREKQEEIFQLLERCLIYSVSTNTNPLKLVIKPYHAQLVLKQAQVFGLLTEWDPSIQMCLLRKPILRKPPYCSEFSPF